MVSKSNSLLVIIPVYNEGKIISKTLDRVISELDKIKIKSNLLIVDDGSRDDSPRIVVRLMKKHPKLRFTKHAQNKGYGTAIQTGIEYGLKRHFHYGLFMDSDLTNNPQDIIKFADQITYDYDCVKGSRYIKGGKVSGVTFKRVLMSRVGNIIASFIFGIGVKDCTNGFRMIKLEKFRKIKLKEKGFAVIMEELYYLKKEMATFKEVPVVLTNRKNGVSRFEYSFSTFYSYIKYPLKSLWQ